MTEIEEAINNSDESRYSRYYRENKDKCADASRAWRLANPEKVKDTKRRYRDRKAEREGRTVGKRKRKLGSERPTLHSEGLTKDAKELIRQVEVRPPIFLREGFDISGGPRSEQIYDKDGEKIQYEGDEDLDLENEALGMGRRGLKAQHAEESKNYYSEHRESEIERSKLYNREHPEVRQRYRRKSVSTLRYNVGSRRRLLRERRVRVITHYGNGKMSCVLCGEARGTCLTIDYEGIGQDRTTRHSGDELYRRLETDGYPKGYHTICFNCQRTIRKEAQEKMTTARLDILEND